VINTLVDAGFSVKLCCRVLGVSRQGYYRYQRRPMSATNEADPPPCDATCRN